MVVTPFTLSMRINDYLRINYGYMDNTNGKPSESETQLSSSRVRNLT